jgi:hypothetical protein
MYETKFHTHVKQELKICFCIFSYLYAYMAKVKRKFSGPNGAKHSLNLIWQALFFFGNNLFITIIQDVRKRLYLSQKCFVVLWAPS